MNKNRYYIKENRVYSGLTENIKIPEDIQIFNFEENKSKNIYVKNKSILEKLEEILENIEKNKKEITISGEIKNFEKIKNKILELETQKQLNKPEDSDYDFIEKTSQLEIIEQILNSINISKLNLLKKNMHEHIKRTSSEEIEKMSELKELLDIEKSKLSKIEKEKKDLETTNESLREEINKADKKIEENVNKKKQLTSDDEKDEKLVELDGKKKKIAIKEEKIKFLIEDNKFEIGIIESKIATIKDEIKMGNNKCINWILMILTLGLIYWTKYSDCRYKVIYLNSKKNRIKEKIAKLQKKENQLKRDIEKIIEKEEGGVKTDIKREFEIKKNLEEIDKKIKLLQMQIQTNQHEIDENYKKIHKLDSKNEDKIKERLMELKVLKEEYDKYSTKNIEKIITKIEDKIIGEINKMKIIKENIQNQKIDLNEEWICEF